ncbi:hypothetical protein M422DRAFT_47804 [Sphaerobolus stellatus SS14]|uniref:Uncharacterized protein n=1 Tax=Sphaerobolus stellatus (strain SS14) TaxID=990650 RepID=A0A0C9UKC5_SPHS4|nr:hypothetical protein M422DRAFT_47804 [Sphaerobolus stellatus SS14]
MANKRAPTNQKRARATRNKEKQVKQQLNDRNLRSHRSLAPAKDSVVTEEVINIDDVPSSESDPLSDFEKDRVDEDWVDAPSTVEELMDIAKKAKVKGGTTKRAPPMSIGVDLPKEFVVFVPPGFKKEGHARLVVPMSVTWDELVELIYKAAGCDRVPRKPEWMQWQFEKRGSKKLDLNQAIDLQAMTDSIVKGYTKSKSDSRDINILFPDDYLKSLRVTLSSKLTAGGRGRKEPLLDLAKSNLSGTEQPSRAFTNSFDHNGNNITSENMTPMEKEKLEILLKKLTSCEGCPHSAGSFCAKHPNGAHVRLTARHVKSWAKCLANELQGADLHFPPSTSPLFVGFFKAAPNSTVDLGSEAPSSQSTPAVPIPTPAIFNQAGTVVPGNGIQSTASNANIDFNAFLAVAMTQMIQIQSHLLSRDSRGPSDLLTTTVPASDQASLMGQKCSISSVEANITYPSFDQFFEELPDSAKNKRETGSILSKLTNARIYQIHELEFITDVELRNEGLALGDIKWLRMEVSKALKGPHSKL